ncbi:hypothetical protein ACKWTF_004308 [Chironomus riparius]
MRKENRAFSHTHERQRYYNDSSLFFTVIVYEYCYCIHIAMCSCLISSIILFCCVLNSHLSSLIAQKNKVRSFGTEDRDTPYPIAPQPTVYDYILFRGSDIKDIRVVNNVAIPNDPAIMQMHLPPNQIPPQQQGFPPQSFPPMQPQVGQYAPFSQMQGPPPVTNNNPLQNIPQQQPPPQQQAVQSPNQQQQQQQQQSQSNQQDSRSGTPNARKSPTSDMGVQTNQHRENAGNKDRMQRNQRNNNMSNMHHNHERRDSGRNDRNNDRIERNDRNNERNNEMYENKGGYRQNNQRMPTQRGGYHNHNNRNNHMRGNQGGSGRMRAPNV